MEVGSASDAVRRAAKELKKSSSERSEVGRMRLLALRSLVKCCRNSRSRERSICWRATGSVNVWEVVIRLDHCGPVRFAFGLGLGVQPLRSLLARSGDAGQ